jgi:hypothetical protein
MDTGEGSVVSLRTPRTRYQSDQIGCGSDFKERIVNRASTAALNGEYGNRSDDSTWFPGNFLSVSGGLLVALSEQFEALTFQLASR